MEQLHQREESHTTRANFQWQTTQAEAEQKDPMGVNEGIRDQMPHCHWEGLFQISGCWSSFIIHLLWSPASLGPNTQLRDGITEVICDFPLHLR